jgi:hypothetical protein
VSDTTRNPRPSGRGGSQDSHDLNLLAENRDVYFEPAAVYER